MHTLIVAYEVEERTYVLILEPGINGQLLAKSTMMPCVLPS